MSKIAKLLVLLLALVMVVSVFAGCGANNQPDDTKPQGNNNGAGSETIANVKFPLEEPVTFNMAVQGQKEYQEMMEKCEWYKYLCEKTNVFIKCVVLGDEPVGKLNTLLTSNNAPDMVLGPVTLSSAQVITLADQGHLIPLDDYVTNSDIMPNYQRLLEATPQALSKMVAPDGHIWSVATISSSPGGVWESPLTVNIEWLKQVPGYENGNFPKTPAEFTEVLRYFKKHDMNGNGLMDDEIPLLMVSSSANGDAQATLQGLMNLWGLGTKDSNNDYYVHIPDNNEVTLAPCTENYRDCLKWVNIWYEEGLIWDRFFENTSSKDLSAVSSNATDLWGFFNGSAWFNNGPILENRSQPWGDNQVIADPFDTGYGVHYFMNPALYGNLNSFMVFSACKEPEVLLAWYDQFLSLEGSLNTYRGLVNEWERYDDAELYRDYYTQFPTWYTDENGQNRFPHLEMDQAVYQDLNQYDQDLSDQKGIDHPTWSSIFGMNAVFKGVTPAELATGQWPEHEYSESVVLGKYIEEHPELFNYNVWTRPYSTADEADELAFLWPDVRTVIKEYESAFITGDLELNDANWEAFQEDMNSAGAEDLIAILQGMWDRQLETNS